MNNDLREPRINSNLRYKNSLIHSDANYLYDAVIIFIDKNKNLYRIRDLHTNAIDNLNLEQLNQNFIIF